MKCFKFNETVKELWWKAIKEGIKGRKKPERCTLKYTLYRKPNSCIFVQKYHMVLLKRIISTWVKKNKNL